MEALISIMSGTSLGYAGILAALTAIIVEVLKNVLPDSFPTKLLALIVAFFVVFGALFISGASITIPIIIGGIFSGFVVSFISMFGFDSLKDIIDRYTGGDKCDK